MTTINVIRPYHIRFCSPGTNVAFWKKDQYKLLPSSTVYIEGANTIDVDDWNPHDDEPVLLIASSPYDNIRVHKRFDRVHESNLVCESGYNEGHTIVLRWKHVKDTTEELPLIISKGR